MPQAIHAFVPYPAHPVAHAATGPLSGLFFGVKDLFDVAGYPTGGGNPIVLARSGIKAQHAPAVQALLDAGARFVGKTVTDELAYSMNGNNAHFGAPLNGAAPERVAGGSSSGSASVVSTELCDFALGSDTSGSVRAPASHCGLYGIRPTHGRVSLAGALPLSPSIDTCGWFARDAHTFARVGEVLLGDDPTPLPSQPRLLSPQDVWAMVADAVLPAFDAPLQRLSAVLGEIRPCTAMLDGATAMFWAFRFIQGREAWMSDGDFITRFEPVLGADVAARFAWASKVSDAQVADAREFRTRFRQHLSDLLGPDGVLVLPTMPDVAPLRNADSAALETYRNTAIQMLCLSGLSGFPQISLPLATRDGAPLGVSLLGPAGSDRSLIALAERLAKAA